MKPKNLFDLTGKVALVTGGATGIGRIAATALATAGSHVIIVSRRTKMCESVAQEINSKCLAGNAESYGGDISTKEGIDNIIKELNSRTKKLDILVNNAGRTWGAPLEKFPYEAWDKVLRTNVTGTFHLTRELIGILSSTASAEHPSRIINIGSVMGEIPLADNAFSYSVSKSAVHHMTRILGKELMARNITVNALAPGPFQSEMTSFALSESQQAEKIANRVPAKRIGRPEDIAACIQFLSGYGGSYITGAIIPVSGGINVETGSTIFREP